MSLQDLDSPAFATAVVVKPKDGEEYIDRWIGLTKREYIAAQVLGHLVAIMESDATLAERVRDAVWSADKLLEELEK